MLVLFAVVVLLILSNPFEVSLLFNGISLKSYHIVDDFFDSELHVRIIQTMHNDKISLAKMHESPFKVWILDETVNPERDGISIGYLIHSSSPKMTSRYLISSGGPWHDGSSVQETRVYLFGNNATALISIPNSLLHLNQTVEVNQYSSTYVIKLHSYEQIDTDHPSPQFMYESIRNIYTLLVSIS